LKNKKRKELNILDFSVLMMGAN